MQLLEQVDHELVAIMLLDRIEAPSEKHFQSWANHSMSTTRVAEDSHVELVKTVTEVKVIPSPGLTPICHIKVLLGHVVVPQLRNRHQALQACVHVAIKCVVLEANNAILILGRTIVGPGPARSLRERWWPR